MEHIKIGKSLAIVDTEDYLYLNQFNWRILGGYAVRHYTLNGRRHIMKMEWDVMDKQPRSGGYQIDHKNLSRLDNRKTNLRWCTQSQNIANRKPLSGKSSKYKGVFKAIKKWKAYIVVNSKYHHLGYFLDEVKAARAYNIAAQEHFGEFAYLNKVV